jgi:hypothetical protein
MPGHEGARLCACGRPIWTRFSVIVDGRKTQVGGGFFLWWLSPGRSKRTIQYQSYFEGEQDRARGASYGSESAGRCLRHRVGL